MSTNQRLLGDDDSDWRLHENIKEIRTDTHIAPDASNGALSVSVNTGTLGTGGEAIAVSGGPGIVDDTRHEIADATLDLSRGDSQPRRDVVYLTDAGTLDVAKGTPAALAWGRGVAETQQTTANAFLPAPRPFAAIAGLPLAIVTVPGNNATSLASRSGVIENLDIRKPAFGADVVEAFERGEFPYRRLSAFDSLATALQLSNDNNEALVVDGTYETSESGIRLPKDTVLIGTAEGGNQADPPSLIRTTATDSEPLFYLPDQNNIMMRWANVEFQNANAARQFITTPSQYSGYVGTDSRWSNINISGFGGDPYTVDLKNVYVESVDNVHIFNRYTNSYGAVRLVNANACAINGLKVNRSNAADGETPAIYLDGCVATTLYSPHVENSATDTYIQISGGHGAIIGAHLEGNSESANSGIQIGDGGVSEGNTQGATGNARWGIYNPVIHGMGVSPPDDIRVLNAQGVHIVGGQAMTINYGGSNNDAQSALSTNPGGVTVRGNNKVTVTNSTSGPAQVDINNGRVFASASAAGSELNAHERGWIDTGSATRLARKEGDGTLRVWRAADDPRRETVTGPITSDHTASHREVVLVDTSGGTVTVTLPAAAAGKLVTPAVAIDGSGDMVIETPGSGTIDGATSATVGGPGSRMLICDGTDWWLIAS